MLNIRVNIEEDELLRNYIKDCIKGQVLSLARKDVRTLLTDVFKTEYSHELDKIVREEIKLLVEKQLNLKSFTDNYIKRATRELLSELIKEKLLAQNAL